MIEAKKIQQLDLNLLKVFECLYQERNMSLVAGLLFISPSAVSHAIKRLRVVLNDPLFVRQGQVMQPTSACQRMAPELIDLLNRLRQVLQSCGEFDLKNTSQVFKVAVHDALEPLLMPKLQMALAKQAPNASLVSVKLLREEMSRELSTHQVDVAIDVALPIKQPINHLALSSDQFCVLMHKDNPLSEQGGLTAQRYINANHIAVSNRSSGSVVEDIALLQQGINRQVSIRCQTYQSAKEVVKSSVYLLTLPSLIAQHLLEDSLIILPVPVSLPPIVKHLYWHQSTEQDGALVWLRNEIKTIFGE